MQNPQDTISFAVTSLMAFGVVCLPWVTWGLSEISLVFYRRTVVRSMRAAEAPRDVASSLAPPSAEPRVVDLQVQTANETFVPTSVDGNALLGEMRRAMRDATKIYTAAGLVYAAVMALAFGLRFRALAPGPLLFLGIAFAWPLVLTALLKRGNRGDSRSRVPRDRVAWSRSGSAAAAVVRHGGATACSRRPRELNARSAAESRAAVPENLAMQPSWQAWQCRSAALGCSATMTK